MWLTILVFSLAASADVRFEAFALKPDNSFEVHFSAPTPQVARGTIDNAQRLEVAGAEVTTTVQAYGKSFVILSFAERAQVWADVVIVEQVDRGVFRRIHHQRIQGQASTLWNDIDNIFRDLQKQNHWDSTLAIRAMVSFFDSQPNRRIKDFFDAVELGHVKSMSRPDPNAKLPAIGKPNLRRRQNDDEFSRETPARREPRRREPQPWEPRRFPSVSQYPGQRIQSGTRNPQRSPSRKRKPKTLFELLFQ